MKGIFMLKRQITESLQKSGSAESAIAEPGQNRIVEALAYQLWLQRGCPVGSDQEDWFQAEEELRLVQSSAA
jgi:hypothetical protein